MAKKEPRSRRIQQWEIALYYWTPELPPVAPGRVNQTRVWDRALFVALPPTNGPGGSGLGRSRPSQRSAELVEGRPTSQARGGQNLPADATIPQNEEFRAIIGV